MQERDSYSSIPKRTSIPSDCDCRALPRLARIRRHHWKTGWHLVCSRFMKNDAGGKVKAAGEDAAGDADV